MPVLGGRIILYIEGVSVKRKLLVFLSYILVAAMAATTTLFLTRDEGDSKLRELEGVIEAYYIDPVDKTVMEDAAAEGMIAGLGDRWSYYIPAAEYASYVEQNNNAYVGIGITILAQEEAAQGFEVMEVLEGGPAEEAGILVGDIVVAVEGQRTAGMDTTTMRNIVRGKEGTFVSITVFRQDGEITMDVERREVKTKVAEYQMLSDAIGLVTIVNFDARCAEESIAAVESLREQGAESKLFDVRNNPGGYAHELVALLDYLLPEGDLFRTLDYSGREDVDTSDADYLDMPMAVLVNADSYSAAEFFAVALQEYNAAVVIGEQTSGKGYFQQTFQLEDGSAVALSTGKYFTPNGISLEGVGITPDVEVTVDDETYWKIYYNQLEPGEDPQILAALDVLR